MAIIIGPRPDRPNSTKRKLIIRKDGRAQFTKRIKKTRRAIKAELSADLLRNRAEEISQQQADGQDQHEQQELEPLSEILRELANPESEKKTEEIQ